MLLAMRPLIPPQPPHTHTPYAYLFPRSTCTHTHITPITPCLQSLILVDEPWYNEPGYEQRADLAASDRYSAGLLPATVKWAMLDQLQHPPDYFADVIRQHFRCVCVCVVVVEGVCVWGGGGGAASRISPAADAAQPHRFWSGCLAPLQAAGACHPGELLQVGDLVWREGARRWVVGVAAYAGKSVWLLLVLCLPRRRAASDALRCSARPGIPLPYCRCRAGRRGAAPPGCAGGGAAQATAMRV